MNRLTLVFLLVYSVLFCTVPSTNAQSHIPEIHCKHFKFGYPLGAPETNDLVIRESYALSTNDSTKFVDWVFYLLTPHETMGTLDLFREWHNDPWIDTLEIMDARPESADDYNDAHSTHDYDRGHLAPLASFYVSFLMA